MTYQINLNDVTKKYNYQSILEDLNLEFTNNNIYVITGPNGSGKTTLLNIIAKYDLEYTGTYHSNNLNIAYLMQDDLLFRNLSVKDNLELKYNAINKDINFEEILKITELLGINSFLTSKVSSLSGGEKKKVAIAQTLISDADVILLDEPTANIQKEHAKDLLNTIYEVFKGKILIIVSHDELFDDSKYNIIKLAIKDKGVTYAL